jgi:hypothetical protein
MVQPVQRHLKPASVKMTVGAPFGCPSLVP